MTDEVDKLKAENQQLCRELSNCKLLMDRVSDVMKYSFEGMGDGSLKSQHIRRVLAQEGNALKRMVDYLGGLDLRDKR